MSYAQCQAVAAKMEDLRVKHERERQQVEAEYQATLPFLGDDIFVLIAAELDAHMLGRLGRVAQRFWRASVPDPAHQGRAPAELWSVAEEGARRRLAAQSEQVRGWVCRGGVGGSWLRALGEAEKLQRPLVFTAHHHHTALSEEGAVVTKGIGSDWRSAVCGDHEMRRGRHYATFTLLPSFDEDEGEDVAWGDDDTDSGAMMGVVGAGFDPTTGAEACESPQGWVLYSADGKLWQNDRQVLGPPFWQTWSRLKEGDVVVRLPVTPPAPAEAHAVCALHIPTPSTLTPPP